MVINAINEWVEIPIIEGTINFHGSRKIEIYSNVHTPNISERGLILDSSEVPLSFNTLGKRLYVRNMDNRPEPVIVTAMDMILTKNYVRMSADIRATDIQINGITMANVGDVVQLTALIIPLDTTNKTVVWSSSDESVARVSETGILSCISHGSVEITAMCVNGVKTTGTIAIEIYPTAMEITGDNAVVVNNTLQLGLNFTPADATFLDVAWKSSNTAVASVDANGLVIAKTVGTTTITATHMSGILAVHSITVDE